MIPKESTSKRLRIKKKSGLKKISAKEVIIKREYTTVCKIIDNAMIEEYGGIYCVSCGILCATPSKSVRSWGHSHLLSRAQNHEYKTFIWNIQPRCQDYLHRKGCHNNLDDRDFLKIREFRDLDDIMETLATYSIGTYNTFVSGLISVGVTKYKYIEFER